MAARRGFACRGRRESASTIASGRGESVLMATPPQARCFGRARRGSANSHHEHVRGPPPLWATGPARSRPFGSGVRAGARCRGLLGFALLAVRLLGGVLRGGLLAALLHRTGEVDEGFEAFLVLLEALGARVDLADRALPGELDDLSRLDLLLADGVGIAVLAREDLGDHGGDFPSVSRERADPGNHTRVRKPRGWPRGGRNGSGVAWKPSEDRRSPVPHARRVPGATALSAGLRGPSAVPSLGRRNGRKRSEERRVGKECRTREERGK